MDEPGRPDLSTCLHTTQMRQCVCVCTRPCVCQTLRCISVISACCAAAHAAISEARGPKGALSLEVKDTPALTGASVAPAAIQPHCSNAKRHTAPLAPCTIYKTTQCPSSVEPTHHALQQLLCQVDLSNLLKYAAGPPAAHMLLCTSHTE